MKLKTKFQDEDFELGEVADVDIATMPDGRFKAQAKAMRGRLHTFFYGTKADFDADWEDAPEEPKGIIKVEKSIYPTCVYIDYATEEEAEKALKKLKAFTRLKGKGFEFRWIDMQTGQIKYSFFLKEGQKVTRKDEDDLLLLFGGEE